MPREEQSIPRQSAVGYAMGDLAISITYFAVGFFFLFYLTDIVGLSVTLAGTVVFIGKLWDGVNDPLVGILSDRTVSRHGRKRVYLIYGAAPFGLSFILLWMIPADGSATTTFLLATALILLFATTYSMVGVPYQALVPVITTDYDERTRLVGFKAVFSAVGTLIGGAIALSIARDAGAEAALRGMAVGFGVFSAAALLVAARSVRHLAAGDSVPITPVPLRRYVTLALTPNVSTLMGHKILGAIATGTLTAILPYFADHVVESGVMASVSLAVYTIVAASLVPYWNRLTHRHDKRRLILYANTAAALVLLIVGALASTSSFTVFLVGSGLLGAAMSAYVLIPPSLVPDLVDWYEFEHGERHESVFFGLWMTFHQIGLGIGGLILGLFLNGFGYVGGADAQTASAVLGVRIAFAAIPGLFLVLSAVLLQRYRITREQMDKAISSLRRTEPQ